MKFIMQYQSFFATAVIACLFSAMLVPVIASAEQQTPELDISPVVIDEKAQPRDILKKTIKIINTSERKLNLYPSVNEVHAQEGEQDFVSAQNGDERAAALSQWIELSRGVVELGPGEEKEISFVIRINLNAVPGQYHARISFSEGGDRAGAEAVGARGEIAVNVEVQADVKEVLQLNKFRTDNFFLSGDDVLFNYQLENIGNQELLPKGEIRIYNRKGEEIASVGINEEGKVISPEQAAQLASVWSSAEGFGRFKAFMSVEYGKSQTASVQDTVYFWIVPWKQLIVLTVVSIIVVVAFAFYFHRWFEQRHLARLALAGMHHLDPRHMHVPGYHQAGLHAPVPEHAVELVPRGPGRITSLFSAVAGRLKRAVPKKEENMLSIPAQQTETQPPSHQPAHDAQSGKPRSLRDALGPAEDWKNGRQALQQPSGVPQQVQQHVPQHVHFTPPPVPPASHIVQQHAPTPPSPPQVPYYAPPQQPMNTGGTINLKHLRQSDARPGESHTIDLKRNKPQ